MTKNGSPGDEDVVPNVCGKLHNMFHTQLMVQKMAAYIHVVESHHHTTREQRKKKSVLSFV